MRLNAQALQVGTDWGEGSHTKTYFIEGERKALIDTGVASSPARDIGPYLRFFGHELKNVDLILNTHGHFDHTAGNPAVVAAGGAEIWMHDADTFMVENPTRHFDTYTAYEMKLMGRAHAIDQARERFVAGCELQSVSRRLKDGDTVDLGKGIVLTVVGLPGHSLGSVGYFWEKEGMLFSGDSAMGQGSRPGIMPVLLHPLVYQTTLDKLLKMPINTLCTGHYYQALSVSSNPIKKGAEVTQYLRDCREINNRILEAVSKTMLHLWQEPFPRIVADAVDELEKHLYLRRDPATGLPMGGTRIVSAFYRDLNERGW